MHADHELDVILNGELLPPPSRVSLADQVTLILRRYIAVGGLEPGARIPAERQLAETLNVSRTVLREALGRLIGEGALVRRSPRVLVVAGEQPESVREAAADFQAQQRLFHERAELRMFVEIGAIPAIIERITQAELRELERLVNDAGQRVARHEPLHANDVAFHSALLRAARNRMVDLLIPLVEEQIRWLLLFDPRQLHGDVRNDFARVAREHRAIFDAVRSHDAQTAMRIMSEHLAHYRRYQFAPAKSGQESSGNSARIRR